MGRSRIEVYRRGDGKWAWRLIARNGRVIAVDGGQGYDNEADARNMAESIIIGGKHAAAVIDIRTNPFKANTDDSP